MEQQLKDSKKKFTTKAVLKFIIPSIIGIILFILPLPWGGGSLTIGVGYMASLFKSSYGHLLPAFMVSTVILSATLTIVFTLIKPKLINENEFFIHLFIVTPVTLLIRTVAAIFGIIFLTQLSGPGFEMITNPNTGGVVINDLFPTLATWFFFSGFFLPLLMEFGSMDYLGTLIRKFMRPLFKVPGRSAIDATVLAHSLLQL